MYTITNGSIPPPSSFRCLLRKLSGASLRSWRLFRHVYKQLLNRYLFYKQRGPACTTLLQPATTKGRSRRICLPYGCREADDDRYAHPYCAFVCATATSMSMARHPRYIDPPEASQRELTPQEDLYRILGVIDIAGALIQPSPSGWPCAG